MEHFDDIEINDSANTIAESVYTALREHLPPMLPHREQDLIRQVADAVYLKLRPIYLRADILIEQANEDARKSAEVYSETVEKYSELKRSIAKLSA